MSEAIEAPVPGASQLWKLLQPARLTQKAVPDKGSRMEYLGSLG